MQKEVTVEHKVSGRFAYEVCRALTQQAPGFLSAVPVFKDVGVQSVSQAKL